MISNIYAKEKDKILSLGFIGTGWIGLNRMQALQNSGIANATLIAEPEEAQSIQALTIAHDAGLATAEEIYRNPSIDGIVIATPSAMHASQAIKALSSGKSVFCQKPLGRSAAEVQEIINASRNADKLLSVDLCYRFTNAFQAVKSVISANEIGNIFAVDLTFHNAYGPDKKWFYDITQSGGGCVIDLGTHLIDMVMHCLNFPEVSEINSSLFHKGLKIKNSNLVAEDYAKVTMLTLHDQVIHLECSWNISAGKDAIIQAVFYGTKGGVAFKNIQGSFYDFTAEIYHGTKTTILTSSPDDWGGRAAIHWAEGVLYDIGFDPVTADEYIKTAKIIDRIYGRTT